MNPETPFQNYDQDDFQWAKECGFLNGDPVLAPQTGASDRRLQRLMIFSGLHAGASMLLAEGTYAMGSSFDCDIVLKDPGIEPLHLTLNCDADGMALLPGQGVVHIDGEPIHSETVLPESPAVVTIAGIHFGLSVDGGAWYPKDFPEIRGDTKDFSGKPLRERAGGKDNRALQPPEETVAINAYSKVALNTLRKAGAIIKFVPVAFVLIFIVSAVFFSRVQTPDNDALILRIEKQFNDWQLPKPTIQADADGFLDITAYVPTLSRKEQINGFLQALPVAVRPYVYAEDQINRSLQEYISKMAFPVEAAYKGHGRVLVQGFVENQQNVHILENLLKSNVTGLRTVDLRVRRMDRVRPELEAILMEADLKDKIDLRPQSGHLLAEGTLAAQERARWQTAKKTIAERLGEQLDIVDRIRNKASIADVPGKIDIPIAGVTMAPYPFVTLQNGKVYFKGASMQNGTIIKEIGPQRIVVEIDGKDYYYNF